MGGLEITAAAVVAAIVAVGGWVWKLASRMAESEAKTNAAEILAAASAAKVSTVERDLAEHREHVAAEYVSRATMGEITSAINRLGDRLDNFFIQFIRKPD
jgi:hypothetical protein